MRNDSFRNLTDDYMGRLVHYLPAEEIEVRESRLTSQNLQKGLVEEAEWMRSASSEGTIEVALDERGKQLTSREFAQWVNEWMISGTRYVSFYIGSANGLDPTFRGQCQRRLSLAKMTLPHEMARMMLAEQLYRAMSIIRGEPYHR
ncbi:23S rRNA (pseudouridine1915-N3)-methyltransferase [Bradymonas sediminis]|nr:23S rRNA (pseudouridine1915-N3)-methyltransferase [Bradymonas sediminis]